MHNEATQTNFLFAIAAQCKNVKIFPKALQTPFLWDRTAAFSSSGCGCGIHNRWCKGQEGRLIEDRYDRRALPPSLLRADATHLKSSLEFASVQFTNEIKLCHT